MPDTNMREVLTRVEHLLPSLLSSPDGWESLLIDISPPRTERVYRYVDGYRLVLHVTYPCKTPYWHKHQWPAAMKIVEGSYDMDIGYGPDTPEPCTTVQMPAGTIYSMEVEDAWHSVNPRTDYTLSIMVTGDLYPYLQEQGYTPLKNRNLPTLSDERVQQILDLFKNHYPCEVVLNGEVLPITTRVLSYEDVVHLAGAVGKPTVTVRTGTKRFVLWPGRSFSLQGRTVINCIHTNNA